MRFFDRRNWTRLSKGALAVDGSCRKVTAELTSSSRAMVVLTTEQIQGGNVVPSHLCLIKRPEISGGQTDLNCNAHLEKIDRLAQGGKGLASRVCGFSGSLIFSFVYSEVLSILINRIRSKPTSVTRTLLQALYNRESPTQICSPYGAT